MTLKHAAALSPKQIEVLSQLPELKGWYWVKANKGGYLRPVRINRDACTGPEDYDSDIIDDGTVWSASVQNLSITTRWLDENTIIERIQEPREPEQPPTYGMF